MMDGESVRVPAEQLTWHDAAVDATFYDKSAQRLTWQVEVFRWDIQEDGDAQPGQAIFEGVQQIDLLHDVMEEASPEPFWWGVLDGFFERTGELLRCRFSLELTHRKNELGGAGYGEVIVTCQNAWFIPNRENTLE